MAAVPKPLGGTIKNPFRSTAQVEPFMNQGDFHFEILSNMS